MKALCVLPRLCPVAASIRPLLTKAGSPGSFLLSERVRGIGHYTLTDSGNAFFIRSSTGQEFIVKRWDNDIPSGSCSAWKHLDIGSANYGPDIPDNVGRLYKRTIFDRSGEIIHRVLFAQADHVIAANPEKRDFVFYLNDVSSSGLDVAASHLCLYLAQKYRNVDIKIRIEKIAADMFKLDQWPSVDSASLLHPFGRIAPIVFQETDYVNHEALKKWDNLFTRVAAASKTGLLVKESNLDGQEVQTLKQDLSSGLIKRGLSFQPADASYIPTYLFPSGVIQHDIHLGYRVHSAS